MAQASLGDFWEHKNLQPPNAAEFYSSLDSAMQMQCNKRPAKAVFLWGSLQLDFKHPAGSNRRSRCQC